MQNLQNYDQEKDYRQQGGQFAKNYQKQANFFNQQQQQQQQYNMQQPQQKQIQFNQAQSDKYNQFKNDTQQQSTQQIMSQQQIQLLQQQQNKQMTSTKMIDELKQNPELDKEDQEEKHRENIMINKEKLEEIENKQKLTEEDYENYIEASIQLSIEYQIKGNAFLQQNKKKEAEKWYKLSFDCVEIKKIIEEPKVGPNGEKLNRRENSKLDWYLQRISIGNALYILFKKKKKVRNIIDSIKLIIVDCENCSCKAEIYEHPLSNIENLYYHLAEFSLVRMQSATQSINQRFLSNQQSVAGQQSFTNITQQQQANLLQQKSEIEETMRYAKQCLNILSSKYKNVQTKKFNGEFILELINKELLEKKQIMFIHVMYLIGRTLQWGEFYPESLSFYKQAYILARSHFKRKGIHPIDGQDNLLIQYKTRIQQVSDLIQNDIDENMSPEQFDKAFREELDVIQVGEDQSKQSKTLSLNFDAIQPYLLTTDVNEMFEGFAPSHARLKSQGIGDEENLIFFTDETAESQLLFMEEQPQKTGATEKSKKSATNRLNTKAGLVQSSKQRSQQMTLSKMQKINQLNQQKLMSQQQSQQMRPYPQIRKSSLNLVTKESIPQGSIQLSKPQNQQNQLTIPNNKNDMFQRKLSRQKTSKIIGYVDQENEITQQLLENRNQKRIQGQSAINELANLMQANYNNFTEYRKELNDFLPQLSSYQSGQELSLQQGQQFSQQQMSMQQQQQPQAQHQNFFEDKRSSNTQQQDFAKNQNSQQSYDQYYTKGIGTKQIGISGINSPNNTLNAYLHSQQQQIQSSFNFSTTIKMQRPLTSNTQLSTYRPASSTRNLNLRIFNNNNDDDNIVELGDQANTSGLSSSRNHNQGQNTPKSPSYLMNSLFKYELLVRPSDYKQGSSTMKKPFQIKKAQYQIRIKNNQNTNNSYHTINEQGSEYQKYGPGTQTPLRQSPTRLKSMHTQNQQNKLIPQGQRLKQRPQTSMAYTSQGNQNRNNQDNLSHFDSNSQIQIPQEIANAQKRPSLFPLFSNQQQAQSSQNELKMDDLNMQIKQMNALQRYKNSFEIFEDDGTYNFVQAFDLDKVISQRYERLIAEEGERNLKDRENSLQKLEYVGPDNKNFSQNQPTLQNDDDLYSEEGDREGMQDEKQQQDNQAANNQNNQQAAQADKEMERGLAMESEKMTKEKEELFLYKQYKNREAKKIDEIYSFFNKVKQCKDRYFYFYQKFNQSVACLWKLEKFKIKFKVYETNNKEVASLANFNLKNKESVYKFTLSMHVESMFFSGKLLFTIQKNDLEFLESFLNNNKILTRWGIADFILNEYFSLPQNKPLLTNFNSVYRQIEEQQHVISFDNTIGSYSGSFQQQENSEVIRINYKLQFLLGHSLYLVKTPTGQKLKFTQQLGNSQKETLNQIPQITQIHFHQHDETTIGDQQTYQRNFLFLKEFLKIRREIVRKTIINLETLSPQIFIRFGILKKMKQYISPHSSPVHSIDQINEHYDSHLAQQFIMIEKYVEEYKKILIKKHADLYDPKFYNEDQATKGQLQQNLTQQQQFQLMNQRHRQKSSIPNLNQMIGGSFKAQQSIRNNQPLQSPPSNLNMIQSYNMTTSINPHITTSRIPYQQNSPNSNSSIDKNQRQFQSKTNSMAQLPELQTNKYSGEIDNQDEINSPNDHMNSSIDSQQSRISIMKGGGGSGSNSNSQGKEDSRQGNFSRQESLRRTEREGSRIENKNSLEEEQLNNQILPLNQGGQNPTIERFFQRNINKKSTFSMIKRNDYQQSDKENSDDLNQEDEQQEDSNEQGGDHHRNVSINLLPPINQKDGVTIDDPPTGRGKQQSDLNEFAMYYQKTNDFAEKLSSSKEMISFEDAYRRISLIQPKQEDIIQQFKFELNLSVSSKSSEVDYKDEQKFENDEEEESILNQNMDRRYRIRNLTHSKSSLESSQQHVSLDMYPNQIPDSINQNINSYDQRALQKNLAFDDKLAFSEQQMFSPRSFTGENTGDYNRQTTQQQYLQQQQESSLEANQKDQTRRKSEDQNEQDNDENKNLFYQEGPSILPQQSEFYPRLRDDSKNLLQISENTFSTQNDYTLQQIKNNQAGSNTTIEDLIKQRQDYTTLILQRQLKIKFSTPQKYIEYFEENKNIAQIAIPNIFINAFRQKDILLCGIMRLGSMSMEEYTRRKEGASEIPKKKKKVKSVTKFDDEEDENEVNINKKYQSQNRQIILDNIEKVNFFVTIQISYTVNAEVEWDIEKLKSDVLIHVEAIQLQSDFSHEPIARYSSIFTFFEFIENLFTEDNDLIIQEYYDTIQRLLKKAAGENYEENSPSTERQNNQQDDSYLQELKEEDFGLNVETLQYEGLYPFTDFNIRFLKTVCNHQFKLNKFMYNIGFSQVQKKILLDRLNHQMITVEKTLKLLPRKIKRFRLLNEQLYFVDDNNFKEIVQQQVDQQSEYWQEFSSQFKKQNMNSPTNVNLSTIQQLQTNLSLYQTKKKIAKLDQEEQKSDDLYEKQSDSYQDQTGDKKKLVDSTENKPQVSNNKISQMNSIEVDDFAIITNEQLYKQSIQDIIASEQIYHLYLIISREKVPALEYLAVYNKQQYEDKQLLILQQQQQQLEQLRQQHLQQQLLQQQQQSQDVIDIGNTLDSQRSQLRIASFPQQSDLSFRRESHLERSLNIRSPQNLLQNNSVSQEIQLSNKGRKQSISTQKARYQFKKQIKGDPKNKMFEVSNEEKDRNYSDGRINHPYAMTFYNTILRVDSEDQKKKRLKEIQKKKREERNILEHRESFRREEDLRIIDNIQSNKDGFRKKIKVEYQIDKDGELNANISFYDPLSYRVETVRIKEQKNLEKLQNLLQVNNPLIKNQRLRNILVKMNMKWNRKIIGRKLEFRSFIETNEEFFNYKLNRKMNPNDEALYKLMTTRNYLDQNKEQFTNFLYKVKLALISNDQNAETAEQNYFFNTYFYSTRVQQFQNITNLGRALIQTTVYQSKSLYTTDNFVFIRIDIAPAAKRTKLIKMILDYNDIITIFSKTKYNLKNCLEPEAITKMIMEFAEKVNYSHTQNYNALKIPFWKQFNQISESSDYDLVNQFDFNSMNTKQEISFLSKKSMLTPVLRTLKIIYQGIKKINGEFLVITVKRYIYLNIDWFQLIIYIPNTCRRFICYLMESDMLKFDADFMEQVIPLIIVKYESNINDLKQSKNYLQFCESFDQMHRKLVMQEASDQNRKSDKRITFRSENWFQKTSEEEINSQQNIKLKNKTSMMHLSRHSHLMTDPKTIFNHSLQSIESIHDFKDNSVNSSHLKMYSNSGANSKYTTQRINFVKFFQKNLTEQTSFLEKKVWEHLISAIIIEENLQHKLVLKINTFNGILRETLSSMVLNMNERDNILYEFYIEEHKRKTLHSIFSKSTRFMLNDSFNQNLYVRIHFFGQDLVHNQKVCGRHMLYSFYKQSRSKLKNTTIKEAINRESSSQVRINLSQTKIGGSGDSFPKIPSHPKISNNQQQQQQHKASFRQRTSITEKKGGIVINQQGTFSKKSQDQRLSQATVQKMKQEQVVAAEDDPFLYSFRLNNMQDMAIFYANKIKANYNKFVKEREKKQVKGKIQNYLSLYKSKSLEKDNYCKALLQPNKNFKRQKEIDPQQIKYFIIYRRILTISPRQMIAIFYKPNKQTFYMYCWNNINSKEIIVKKKLRDIEKFIPHATQFLNAKLYKELGDRIFVCFKNQILLQTYNNLKLE